jgi:hypothetical protein
MRAPCRYRNPQVLQQLIAEILWVRPFSCLARKKLRAVYVVTHSYNFLTAL